MDENMAATLRHNSYELSTHPLSLPLILVLSFVPYKGYYTSFLKITFSVLPQRQVLTS